MRVLDAALLGREAEALIKEVSTELPSDVLAALEGALAEEESPAGREALRLIIENAAMARELGVPICQDTGLFTVYITLGSDTGIEGDLGGELDSAVTRATMAGSLRASIVCETFEGRINTGDNTPALLEIEYGGGDQTTLGVLAKGGGSENASRLAMLPPGAGAGGIADLVTAVIEEVGARSCPPLILGIGIGGSFDRAPRLAKAALMEPLDSEPAPGTAALARRIVEQVNGLGIGPGAVGGTVTCLGARVRHEPCHIASLPVAVSVGCHALRRKTTTI
ncbi:MAG: fumarate hydratase [Actinobacteria bacterium]|nr:fumarate hydratase [Actinomycetota bacterium]MBU1942330.1 fumarate hydratase [Actinomycetota bacterium]MBU2686886.1 fumarate hydratase [Actinomycetota bacterium]